MRLMRRVLSVFVVLLLVMCVAATGVASKRVRLGVIMVDTTYEFFVNMMYGGNKAAKDWNAEVIWKDSQGSLEKQLALFEDFIQQKVDVILVDPVNAKGIIPGVEKAGKAGIPVVSMGNFVDSPYVTTNTLYADYENTKKAVDFVAKKIGGKGKIVALLGPIGSYTSDQRQAGLMAGLKANPGLELLALENAAWDPSRAIQIMEDWLVAFPKIDVAYIWSEGLALAAVEAIKAAGRNIMIITQDGEEEGLKAIERGDITATTMTNAQRVGYWNIMVGAEIARGRKVDKKIYLTSYLITKDNVAEGRKHLADYPEELSRDMK